MAAGARPFEPNTWPIFMIFGPNIPFYGGVLGFSGAVNVSKERTQVE